METPLPLKSQCCTFGPRYILCSILFNIVHYSTTGSPNKQIPSGYSLVFCALQLRTSTLVRSAFTHCIILTYPPVSLNLSAPMQAPSYYLCLLCLRVRCILFKLIAVACVSFGGLFHMAVECTVPPSILIFQYFY